MGSIVEYYTHKNVKFAIIEQIVQSNGFKVVFLLRLSPIIPYNIFNLFMGITSVKLMDFICAHPGMLPETIMCCFIGGSIANIYQLKSANAKSSTLLIIIAVIGTVIAICGIVYISKMAKKEFNKLSADVNETDTEIQLLVQNDNKTKII